MGIGSKGRVESSTSSCCRWTAASGTTWSVARPASASKKGIPRRGPRPPLPPRPPPGRGTTACFRSNHRKKALEDTVFPHMPEPVIKTVNLTKRYGSLVALSNLNLEIQEGDCFGFIGPNGAGKTTTIKVLATLLQPTWGEARVCGYVVGYQSRQIRPLMGYVPDYFGAYEDMVVQEYLEFFAAAYNINGSDRVRVVGDVLELTDLAYKHDAPVDGLSRGMKQRLSIARVLLHDPRVLLLDEPGGNLEPRARIELRELLKALRSMGKTIVISSHILPELQDLCNTVGIIEQGELLYAGPWTDI